MHTAQANKQERLTRQLYETTEKSDQQNNDELAFIIAIESIMKACDPSGELSTLGLVISSLCYADVIALLDSDPAAASTRCTKLAKEFLETCRHADRSA
jgi:hypothetical protein